MTRTGNGRAFTSKDFSHSVDPGKELTREDFWTAIKGKLSAREWQCVRGMMDGLTQAQIAKERGISQQCVSNLLAGAFEILRAEPNLEEDLEDFADEDDNDGPRALGRSHRMRREHGGRGSSGTWDEGNRDDV